MHISYVKEGVFEKDEIMPRASLQEVGLTMKDFFIVLYSIKKIALGLTIAEKFYDFLPTCLFV